MDHLLDTCAFSDLMREHPLMDSRMKQLGPNDRVFICTIVRGGILHGIHRLPSGRRKKRIAEKAGNLLTTIPCEPVMPPAGDAYAEVKLLRQRQGLPLDENDLWIAATALAMEATVVTRDTDFRRIDGPRVEDWTT